MVIIVVRDKGQMVLSNSAVKVEVRVCVLKAVSEGQFFSL